MQMNNFSKICMPTIICGRGSLSFVTTLEKKKVAVLGYSDHVRELAEHIFKDSKTEVLYVATINHEPLVSDIYDNLGQVADFQPDMILAVGGGSVMDVAKGLHLFYENPQMSFEDSLKPFSLPVLGKRAVSIHVPTTSGTGSETSSAAVFIDSETQVKKLLLSNTLIPHYAVLDPNLTDQLPSTVQTATGLDALCHAIESTTAKNANLFTKAVATQAALDILEYLPIAADDSAPVNLRMTAKEKLHMAATMAGIAITNSCTGIVHSYDHPGPAFGLPHGTVCGIMLSHSMELIGPTEEYAAIAKRLGYSGDTAQLSRHLIRHIQEFNRRLGIHNNFQDAGVGKDAYFQNVPVWAEISIPAFATQMSPADMDIEKGERFYEMCYYGSN